MKIYTLQFFGLISKLFLIKKVIKQSVISELTSINTKIAYLSFTRFHKTVKVTINFILSHPGQLILYNATYTYVIGNSSQLETAIK